jgi:hypothetical protein
MSPIVHIPNLYKVLGEECVDEIQAWLDQVYDSRREMENLKIELKMIRDELKTIRNLIASRRP